MHIPTHLKDVSKVLGYFSYTESGKVCCDGDACIIAGSEEKMRFYIDNLPKSGERDIIKKTRFDEVINGLRKGGEYAFDEESYNRFYDLATLNGIEGLPAREMFLDVEEAMHFIIIKIG